MQVIKYPLVLLLPTEPGEQQVGSTYLARLLLGSSATHCHCWQVGLILVWLRWPRDGELTLPPYSQAASGWQYFRSRSSKFWCCNNNEILTLAKWTCSIWDVFGISSLKVIFYSGGRARQWGPRWDPSLDFLKTFFWRHIAWPHMYWRFISWKSFFDKRELTFHFTIPPYLMNSEKL